MSTATATAPTADVVTNRVILNLTQHNATPEQIAAGVIEPSSGDKAAIKELLTFTDPPCAASIRARAARLAVIASAYTDRAMIGGAPYLMAPLESELMDAGITPLYAFSRRESVEETQDDGSVVKRSVFKHVAFVEAY